MNPISDALPEGPSPADDEWLSEEMTLADIASDAEECCVFGCHEPAYISAVDADGWGGWLCRRHAEGQ